MPKGTVECIVWGNWVQLWAWPKEAVRNSFSPVFIGRLRSHHGGTLIDGRFMLHPIVLLFLVVWLGGALIGLGFSIYNLSQELAKEGPDLKEAWFPLLFAAGILTFGTALVYFGIRAGRGQRRDIEEYLRDTLHARELGPY